MVEGLSIPLAPGEWQKYCTKLLMETLALPEHQRAQAWLEARQHLSTLADECISDTKQRRLIIADALLRNQRLEDFDFSYCYITRTDLRGADLRNTKFRFAIIRQGTFNDANARGANFSHSDLEGTSIETMQYNENTKLNFARFRPAGSVSLQLQDRVRRDRIAAAGRNAPVPVKLLNWLTAYGFGIVRLLIVSVFLIVCFAVAYWMIGASAFYAGTGDSGQSPLNFWSYLLLSLERFLNASPWIFGVSPLAHLLTAAETLIGFVMLAILIAIVVRHAVRLDE